MNTNILIEKPMNIKYVSVHKDMCRSNIIAKISSYIANLNISKVLIKVATSKTWLLREYERTTKCTNTKQMRTETINNDTHVVCKERRKDGRHGCRWRERQIRSNRCLTLGFICVFFNCFCVMFAFATSCFFMIWTLLWVSWL